MVRRITLIAAVSLDNVIGKGNTIPWKCSEDFKHFKKTTMGHAVIMGRKTFESLGSKPLPGRFNIVLTSAIAGEDSDCIVKNDSQYTGDTRLLWATSLEYAIAFINNSDEHIVDREIFIIGGESIYTQTIHCADRIILSYINILVNEGASTDLESVTFPPINRDVWKIISKEDRKDSHPSFSIVTYDRILDNSTK